MIKQIKAFKTTDGKTFDKEEDAKQWQSELDFDEFYKDNYPLGNYVGTRVELSEMKDWLKQNKAQIINFLNVQ